MSRGAIEIFRICVGAAILFGAAIGVAIFAAKAQQEPLQPEIICVTDVEEMERIRSLTLDSIEQAFKEHVKTLFDNWMADPSKQPARAQAGFQRSVRAYKGARQQALKWFAPTCK